MGRPLRDRLAFDLARVRAELIQVVSPINDLSYAPAAGMNTYREQMIEIGAADAESISIITVGEVPAWSELESKVTGRTTVELLDSLALLREQLIVYLGSLSDQELSEAVDVPPEWASLVGDTTLEREELFRWLARHEYYHLGQIITYRWIQGFRP
jgi:uncharacterized damage-inducible protein DinB